MRALRVILFTLFLTGLICRAQEAPYKFDLGAGAGISGYLGDVNQTNMFRNPGFAAQAGFRYIIDSRWALRTAFTAEGISGNSAQFSNKFPDLKDYKFKSTVYSLDFRGEFNFLAYGMGETFKRLKRWSPYLAIGIGGVLSTTEGKVHGAFTLPLAAGFKFKLRERLNLTAEFCMTKAFGDKLDGDITDLQGIKSSFAKNTDWYSNILISLTYEFGKRCETCHYQK
ncbi:MAG: porin family protein [Bacteroides sp.]|nr:porin family protein [Bacteroides sp.]MCM1379596.1 porin family protein [Bacteroides sp.]MCM1446022.1 porin family protein [Prevotella sp.]